MALPAFDTHAYVKRLKAVGFSEPQAEAQAELQSQVLAELVTEKLATKEDVKELKDDIKALEIATKADIAELKADMKTLDAKIESVNKRIGDQLTLIGVIGTLIAILVGIHSFFPNVHF